MNKHWGLVLLAGFLEIFWVSGLKYSTEWWHWALTIGAIALSFKVLIEAASKLPLGTVYAVFTGIGTAGTVLMEILVFGEPANPIKLFFIATLAGAVIGLKLVTKDENEEAKEGAA
ncbi:DMT family transporter [Paenibacillus agilis]|uniref:Multidrug efflux SMR transporter n=1 Tax=Paenibacillus agilis TaxID=3020863 RepID=A0A559IPI1_9BACL|nr:multidrug efflux SMR transporter [Paenibacillus agilis]TVX89535.1 multidrug efflux SMR transporter [Paenibacillus agilis]